jgi:hypothetical protein
MTVPSCAPVQIEDTDIIIFKVCLTWSLKAVLYKDNYNISFLRHLSSVFTVLSTPRFKRLLTLESYIFHNYVHTHISVIWYVMLCIVVNVHKSLGQSRINEFVSQAAVRGFRLYGALRRYWNNQKYSLYAKEFLWKLSTIWAGPPPPPPSKKRKVARGAKLLTFLVYFCVSGQPCFWQNASTYLSSCQESYPKCQYYHRHRCFIYGRVLI